MMRIDAPSRAAMPPGATAVSSIFVYLYTVAGKAASGAPRWAMAIV
ncbi:gp43 [Burkholderia phage KL3]|uniref:Gp43 n=1 Tax=Burkholderia phage KL3 TaxID=910474 RepID=E5E3X2_9CAUD|nr:gp43 [Burkholderia phage KL3]ADP02336.1 gp43 [Burkholderia phage KL3]